MNSRQRVCQALRHEQPDRLPKGFFATADFMAALRRFLGVDDDEQALNALKIDLRHVEPVFIGPAERSGGLQHCDKANSDFWGVPRVLVTNKYGTYSEIAGHPLASEKRHPAEDPLKRLVLVCLVKYPQPGIRP